MIGDIVNMWDVEKTDAAGDRGEPGRPGVSFEAFAPGVGLALEASPAGKRNSRLKARIFRQLHEADILLPVWLSSAVQSSQFSSGPRYMSCRSLPTIRSVLR